MVCLIISSYVSLSSLPADDACDPEWGARRPLVSVRGLWGPHLGPLLPARRGPAVAPAVSQMLRVQTAARLGADLFLSRRQHLLQGGLLQVRDVCVTTKCA